LGRHRRPHRRRLSRAALGARRGAAGDIIPRGEDSQSVLIYVFFGGGNDRSVAAVRIKLAGGLGNRAAGRAWFCPPFESRVLHCDSRAMHHQMDGKNGWAALGDNGSDLLELLEFRRTDVNLCQQTNGPEFGARLSVHPRANACSAHRTPSEAKSGDMGRSPRPPVFAALIRPAFPAA